MMPEAFRTCLLGITDAHFVGVFASASVLCFISLSKITALFGTYFNERILRTMNVLCGSIMIFYGAKLPWNLYMLCMHLF